MEVTLIIQFVFEILVSSEMLLIYENSFIVNPILEFCVNKSASGCNYNKLVSPVGFEI